jgi:16S rRNA (guanine966-N2)-methyltransferase
MLRVIAGEAKGKKLYVPDLASLRPTSDRVREAMFDVLESRGLVRGSTVLDLFSGSGALGIEALSRGAAGVTFVEQDRKAVRAIEANLETTGYRDARHVEVVQSDALTWLELHGHQLRDLAFADPPYGFASWAVLLDHLGARNVIVEHAVELDGIGSYLVSRRYRYGGTLVTLLHLNPGAGDAAKAESPEATDPDKDIT